MGGVGAGGLALSRSGWVLGWHSSTFGFPLATSFPIQMSMAFCEEYEQKMYSYRIAELQTDPFSQGSCMIV